MDSCFIYGALEIILLFDQQCLRSHLHPWYPFPIALCLPPRDLELIATSHVTSHLVTACAVLSGSHRGACGDILDAISFYTIMVSHFVFQSGVSVPINWWNLYWFQSLHFARRCGNGQGITLIQRGELFRTMLDTRSVRVHTFKHIKCLQLILSSP